MSSISFSQTSNVLDTKILSNHSINLTNEYNANKSTGLIVDNVTVYRQDPIKSNMSNNFAANIVNDGNNGTNIEQSTANPNEIGYIIISAIILSVSLILAKVSRTIVSFLNKYILFANTNEDGGIPTSYRYKKCERKGTTYSNRKQRFKQYKNTHHNLWYFIIIHDCKST
jgi:hypothetical protein